MLVATTTCTYEYIEVGAGMYPVVSSSECLSQIPPDLDTSSVSFGIAIGIFLLTFIFLGFVFNALSWSKSH